MQKKIRKVMSVFMVSALLFSGCGIHGTDNVKKEEDNENNNIVKLTVWSEKDNVDTTSKMVESFKEHYKDEAQFDITIDVQADAKVRDVMLTDVHNGADVFSFPDDQLTSLVAGGVLVEIPDAEKVKSANIEESVKAATLDDKIYAYPMTADNGYIMYYDKNYFSADDVKSLDKMMSVAASSGKKFAMEFNSGWYMYTFFGNTGLEFGINDDGVTNYCNWNATDGAIKGVDVAQAILNIATNPAFISQPDGDFITGVQNGTVSAGISGVWNAVSVREAWGDNYGAVKLPTYTVAGQQVQMSSFTGYKMMGVNAYSKYPEWAAKLADWLTNEENQTIRFEERNQGPSNTNAAASDAVKQVPAIQAVIAQSEFGKLQRVGNSYWDACSAFSDTMAAGNPSGQDLQEIMDTLVEGITASAAK